MFDYAHIAKRMFGIYNTVCTFSPEHRGLRRKLNTRPFSDKQKVFELAGM